MRILVTGATGFVGSHAVEALGGVPGVEVIVACRDPSKLVPGFDGEVRVGDLRDPAYIESLLHNVDTIVHAAAWTALWNHKEQSDSLYLAPSLNLIKAARQRGIGRFVYISTVSAAAPESSSDPMSPGRKRSYWPHEANVVSIENELRAAADSGFCAVNLRLGLFAGSRYALGVLPILAPRLKTHLVPWVSGGRTSMPIIDGRDIGTAIALAATAPDLSGFEGFNIIGPEVPTVREVLDHLHVHHGLPRPHFSVSFPMAFAFGWLMEKLDRLLPWEPLVTRSIVHLLEETAVDNSRAMKKLGYVPKHHWKQAVDRQMAEMSEKQKTPMRMARPLPANTKD